ncbi:MAG: glycoside hydrolase family 2 TIM barrel-domain containing protein [Firmicutes bacterium]|nr:glycoside hydrolase family 2 TIM barrel-domain containing protein [Bacillota bacterium]
MKKHSLFQRIGSLILALALLLPFTVVAADGSGETYKGDPQTVMLPVGGGAVQRSQSFNEDWKFNLGTSSTAQNKDFDDSNWSSVSLPHDFSMIQAFTTSGEAESGFLPGGTGWYRKSFTLAETYAGKTLILNFDGVYSDAYVYVNGTQVGENHYGYTAFAFDITDYVTCDGITENVIAVKAVNSIPTSRWYSGSGIYRDVTLFAVDPVHVDLNGTQVTTPDIENGVGTVNVVVDVVNDGDASAAVTVTNTVLDAQGSMVSNAVSATATVEAGTVSTVNANPTVSNPSLWSPENPALYYVHTTVSVDGTEVDSYDTEFGFRYFRFDVNTGFFLNGQALKLNGVCLHHDQGALGSAAYYDAMYRQLSIMKDMGVNAVRTSHNPADQDFIHICNELGLLVVEEAFDTWTSSKNGNSNDFAKYFNATISASNNLLGAETGETWAKFCIQTMVNRDKNAPCIIMWSLGNEIGYGSDAATIAQNLIDWVKEVDTTRPTTIGCDKIKNNNSYAIAVANVIANNGGVVGNNYTSDSQYSSLHTSYSNWCIYGSETSSAVNSRSIYCSQNNNSDADGKLHLTSYDTSAVGWGSTAHVSIYNTMTKDYVAGEFVWTGFDYLGEPTPWNGTGSGSVSGSGAIPNSSYFGIVETTGFEKDTYYLYRSQWNQDTTTLHLVTAWDDGNMLTSSGKTPVVIYSNAPVVKLYRNGTLIGTATRTVNTTSAGHTYYTYTTASNDTSICSAVSGSGSTSLYATFNVAYEAGTISAKAFEADGTTEIALTGNSGKSGVSTPGTVSKLEVSQNKTEIAADGSSLVYIAVDVVDANGVLDTTATNTINFSLTGDGVILGVDNGDQATTAKYQQSSVLTGATTANIAAYAGKALVIVRSTKEAGSFTVNVTSSGLTGGSATVATTAVDSGTTAEGLVSYTMVRDYSVKVGTVPTFETTATGNMADGTTVDGTIVWDMIPETAYNTTGDYSVTGSLTFQDHELIKVSAKLHVIANVVALRNISTATASNAVPNLPTVVSGVLENGTISGEFAVTWESPMADQFATVGSIVTVRGTAAIIGEETLPVTCTVRVAEAVNTESTNVAPVASLSEDCASTSDNLSSIVDGVTNNSSDTNARWTNYNNRNTSETATITFTWTTAQLISSVNLYYFTDNYSAALPANVQFAYSLNGIDFTSIGYEDVTPMRGLTKTEYVFETVVNPIALQVTLTEQSGHCVGLTEAEVMTYAGAVEYNTSADLSGITVDGISVENFAPDTLEYTAQGSAEAVVAASTDVNAGITVLPVYENVVRILTVSEDAASAKTYAVTLDDAPVCAHENTVVRNETPATCTGDGYTGDTYCLGCGALLESGTVIPATGHTTELRNAKSATCTEEGYTGDLYCTTEKIVIETGTVIPATGHIWNEGVITKEPTESESGVRTFTCTVCGATRTEEVPYEVTKTAPTVAFSAAPTQEGRLALTGQFVDYENVGNYYDVTAHGLVYLATSKLGTRNLTVNTPGRTRVNFSSYKNDGSFTYNMKPAYTSTKYTVRAFLAYVDPDTGRTVYVYSAPVIVSYQLLSQMQ